MKHRFLPFFCAGLLIFPVLGSAARACLNDRDSDSPANEAKGLPDVVRVVTGRFERNPPLFYQMRIDRVQREVAQHPDRLALYDDVAVAYDRLGKDNEAIAWIEKKRTRLAGTVWETARPEIREAWYRYYANIGTFRVHRWIKSGADRKKLAEVTRARDEIARALQIKPDAHFNRERTQLAAMNWIIDPYQKPFPSADASPVPFSVYLRRRIPRDATEKRREGLTGLIVLGNAWESPDIIGALADTLRQQKKNKLAYFACLRCRELLATKHNSLLPVKKDAAQMLQEVAPSFLDTRITNAATVETQYRELRDEADAWQNKRMSYMIARLQQGRHPDTDALFWSDFKNTPPPRLDVSWFGEWRGNFANYLNRAFRDVLGMIFLAAVLGAVSLKIASLWRNSGTSQRF